MANTPVAVSGRDISRRDAIGKIEREQKIAVRDGVVRTQFHCLGESLHRGFVGAVAFVNPVRDIERCVMPQFTKPVDEQRGRGSAINIIIGKNGHALASIEGAHDAGGGALHVFEGAWIWHELAQLGREEACGLLCVHTTTRKDLRQCAGQVGVLYNQLSGALKLDCWSEPFAPCQGSLNA